MKPSANMIPNVLIEIPKTSISGCTTPQATAARKAPGAFLALEVVERVGHLAVDADLEVQVVAVAAAGAARVADDLALGDMGAHRGGEARLVRVTRRHGCRVLDAGEVAVAAGLRLALHQGDRARGGRADRRAGRDADVDARVAGLPRALLAERRGDRPVDRPDELPAAAADRAGRHVRDARQRVLDLGLLGAQVVEPALELVALRAD